MLGESCWPAFRDRVQRQYNYSRYTCHQTTIDGLHRGKFEQCAAEAERLCVRPFCTPRITIVSFPSGQNTPTSVAKPATHPLPHPPPRLSHEDLAAAAEAAGQRTIYPGPKLVMLGCEGCGVPELWRTLVAARPPGGRLQVALVNQGEPAWRDRQVHFFDHESRFIYGSSWYFGRWPHGPASSQQPAAAAAVMCATRASHHRRPRPLVSTAAVRTLRRRTRQYGSARSIPKHYTTRGVKRPCTARGEAMA